MRRNGTDAGGNSSNSSTDAGADTTDCPAAEDDDEEKLPPGNATIVLVVRMPYSIEDFDESKQARFKLAIASLAGVNESTIGESIHSSPA